MNYETLFSVIPADAGIQIQPTRVWIPFFKGMTEIRANANLRVFRNSKEYNNFMPYKINERISDTRIAVRGRNQEQLFTDAFLGMLYVMKPTQGFAPEKAEREVFLESIDTSTLLADFLNEVSSLATENKEFYTHIIFYRIQPTSLRAKIFGISIESFHRHIKPLFRDKAEVKLTEDGAWEAVLILND